MTEIALVLLVAVNVLFAAIFSPPTPQQSANPVTMGGPGSGDPATDPLAAIDEYFSAAEIDQCLADATATESETYYLMRRG